MEGIRTNTETPRSTMSQAVVWFSIGLAAAVAAYASALRMRAYGTTYVFWLFIAFISGAALATRGNRSRLKFLFVLCLSLATIRTLSASVDVGLLNLFSIAGLWCIATVFVATAIYATATTLHVPLWPDSQREQKPGNRRDNLWLPIVLRPAAMFTLPLSGCVAMWGLRWSHLSESCVGITISSAIAIACLLPLCSLWTSILSTERKIRLSNLNSLPKQQTKKLVTGSALVYFWGLSSEWKASENYFLWSLLALTLFIAVLLFRSLPALGIIPESTLIPAQARWSRPRMLLFALSLMLFAVSYVVLLSCILR